MSLLLQRIARNACSFVQRSVLVARSTLLLLLGLAVWASDRVVPKRRLLLLSCKPDVDDQSIAVLRWLDQHNGLTFPVVLLTRGPTKKVEDILRRLVGGAAGRVRAVRMRSLAGLWAYWRSNVVLLTHGLYDFSGRRSSRRKTINLWHGMPIKNIWHADPNPRWRNVTDCDMFLATSTTGSKVMSRLSGLREERFLPIGLPRNDLLFSCNAHTQAFRRTVATGVDRVILFLPTFRKAIRNSATEDQADTNSSSLMSHQEVRDLKVILHRIRARMIFKPHPVFAQSLFECAVERRRTPVGE